MISAPHEAHPPTRAPAPPPLRVMSRADANIGLEDVVVRPRKPGQLVVMAVALGMAGWTAWSAAVGGLPWGIASVCSAALLILTWTLYRQWLRTMRPGAWQMAIGRDRVLIRYRGVMDTGTPPGNPQVIELPLAHVRGVWRLKRTVKVEASGDHQHRTYEYLNFRVQGCDLRPLQVVLLEEQRDRADEWFTHRDPAVVVTAGVLRVETAFQGSGVEPGTDELLRQLTEHVPLEPEAAEYIDVSRPASMLPEERDDALRAVAETSVPRALMIARKMQPDASDADVQAHVLDLIACPDPAAVPTPAAAPRPSADGVAAPGKATLPAPRILRRWEAELRPEERLVMPRATGTLFVSILFAGLAGWMAWRGWTGAMHWGWAGPVGGLALLLAWGGVGSWRRSRRPEAWQMAIGPERILVPLRSYMHARLRVADDPQILELPLAHLVSARGTQLKRMRPRRGSQRPDYSYFNCVDLRTRGMDLGPLHEALAAEGELRPDGSRTNVTVRLAEDGVVRMETKASWDQTTALLRMVGERVPREEDIVEVVDLQGRLTRTLLKPTAPARKQAAGRGSGVGDAG
jgi:hypothetical protein